MKAKKWMEAVVAAILVIGFFSAAAAMEAKASPGTQNVTPQVKRVHIVFPEDIEISYSTHPDTGCIQYFYNKEGKRIEPKKPDWLKEGKTTFDFGSFTNPVCREGVISVGGSPIEYWGYAGSVYYCLGAYDPACPEVYIPCRDRYPSCD